MYDSGDDEGSDCVNNNENNTNEIAETHTKYEIEITAIIKPEYRQNGIFTKLFAALRQLIDNECVINNIYTPVITYIAANPRKQKDNTQSPDMTYAYSDYLMSVTPDKICPIHSNTVLNETSDKVSVKVSDKFPVKFSTKIPTKPLTIYLYPMKLTVTKKYLNLLIRTMIHSYHLFPIIHLATAYACTMCGLILTTDVTAVQDICCRI